MILENLGDFKSLSLGEFESTWQSPSNIAFIKYWGKRGHQIPANPSLSMTLKECTTTTKVKFSPADKKEVSLFLNGKEEKKFALKIDQFLNSLASELPWIQNTKFSIETSNTFPHGTGIASSASGMSAFALCLADYMGSTRSEAHDSDFFKRASYIARLGSGSACRSVYGGFTSWGECELKDSSDYYATPFDVHPELAHLQDSVLVISDIEKKVSSTHGHQKMKEHPFAEARFNQAKTNFTNIVHALKTGDLEVLGEILEAEALTLHAMMMTSPASYTLLKPNTLLAIELIRDIRQQTKLPLYFTLDAGPNLHLIFPLAHKEKIETFIHHELAPLSVNLIKDQRGEGPKKCL